MMTEALNHSTLVWCVIQVLNVTAEQISLRDVAFYRDRDIEFIFDREVML